MKKGQVVKAESDAVITMSNHVQLGSRVDGGIISGIMRGMLSGESFFLQTLSSKEDDSDVLLGASAPGDIMVMELGKHIPAVCCRSGAFLAADDMVHVETVAQSTLGAAVFSGSGVFVLKCSGPGNLALSSEGAILKYTLRPGEIRRVDNGHLVAWDASMRLEMGLATSNQPGSGVQGFLWRLMDSASSGEGLMCHLTGPGSVFVQSHKASACSLGNSGSWKGRSGSGRSDQGANSAVACCFLIIFFTVFVFIAAIILYTIASDKFDFGMDENMAHHRPQTRLGDRPGYFR
eukprot:CAMPEP_0117659412 /NCGR_PEP_ID=MMETSP0804-20121206/6419_1 /TAXON_ID=1074897 /ORGANISM="Tetraselmis astigmatica, Strain CCMP880" /LENGTH=290 /DNA_ID=CAMNT_0005466069 /DNA_START=235 /DNA_END=1107 /DNA_ORIENTATION=-